MRLAIKMDEQGVLSDADLDAPEGSLAVLQAGVEGYIERVTVRVPYGPVDMWVNEEGLYLLAERHNPFASTLMHQTYGQGYINGPVVFTSAEADSEGDTLGLTAEESAEIRAAVGMLHLHFA